MEPATEVHHQVVSYFIRNRVSSNFHVMTDP